jgi:hypothetical protein
MKTGTPNEKAVAIAVLAQQAHGQVALADQDVAHQAPLRRGLSGPILARGLPRRRRGR